MWGGVAGQGSGVQDLHWRAQVSSAAARCAHIPAVLRIQIRIHRIHIFFGLLDPDPDPLVKGMDPDPALDPDPSITKQK